jgi:molybdate transport system substrate-binding protein
VKHPTQLTVSKQLFSISRRLLRRFLAPFVLVLGLSVLLPAPASSQPTPLLVAAAASLQDALKEVTPGFEKANPGIKVTYNFAASGPLQQQIEQGAPVDLFISAATRPMDSLQQKNLLLANSRRNLLTNRLALVVPRNSTLAITSFKDLVNPKVKKIAVGEPRSVPVGQYAEEVFKNLGILAQLRPKFVLGNSVRNVLSAVESGNVDAGIVYVTDAKVNEQVKQVAIASDKLHSPIVYPMAIMAASRHQSAARSYAQFIGGRDARAVFQKYGFGIARA